MCFSLFPSQLTATKQQVLIYSKLSSMFTAYPLNVGNKM